METSLSDKLTEEAGDLRKVKNSVLEGLTEIAESHSCGTLSDQSKSVLARFIENASRGFVSSMSMVCKGKSCPYIEACPLYAAGSALPIGRRCPVEDSIAALQIAKHLQALGIDDVNDPAHSFDMDMLCEIAGLELIRWRCGVNLSKKPDLLVTNAVGATNDGEMIFQDVPNPMLDIISNTGKHISKLRDALVATRKAQLTAGHDISDVSKRAAELRKKAEATRKIRMQQIKDAEYTVEDEKSEDTE